MALLLLQQHPGSHFDLLVELKQAREYHSDEELG
jgi:hypothetical protein